MRALYDYSWFVGFAVSFAAYYAMMRFQRRCGDCPAENRLTPVTLLRFFCFQEFRQHVALINVERLLFIAAHQINVELGNAHIREFAQFVAVSLGRTNQAEAVHDFIRNKVCIVAFDLAMVLVIILAAILHKRG